MLVIWCVFMCFVSSRCFNIDIHSKVLYYGTNGSMFGYSVQAHIDGNEKMVLVGSPRAYTNRVTNLKQPGAVFRCNVTAPDICKEMIFDHKGNKLDKLGRVLENKADQWFGATLNSAGGHGPIVACAPRYVQLYPKIPIIEMEGLCLVAESSKTKNVTRFEPRVDNHEDSKAEDKSSMGGFSAALSKTGEILYMGFPARNNLSGVLMSQNLVNNSDRYLCNLAIRDLYLGYSVAAFIFAGDKQGVAVSVPRGEDLKGLVILYTWNLKEIKRIRGPHFGAYFGYSLASADIDGDGFDDVIIGCPMFTDRRTEGSDYGRIYVFYQGKNYTFDKTQWITGEVSKGRFGLSVASLGDINLDGFGDIAVGAPYGGAEGRGVVYIYHGSELGLHKKFSQAITAEEVSAPPYFTTFGFSISGGVDLDSNSYTDLVVGAYESDAVVFLRSRPIVYVMFDWGLTEEKFISLNESNCGSNNYSCTQVSNCVSYDGIRVDEFLDFNISLELDFNQKRKRLLFLDNNDSSYYYTMTLSKGIEKCTNFTVYLQGNILDEVSPINVLATILLKPESSSERIKPILKHGVPHISMDFLKIRLMNCGKDNECVPDLKLAVTTSNIYTLGSNEGLEMTIHVENDGEDAYGAVLYMTLPNGVMYKRTDISPFSDKSLISFCSMGDITSGNTTLKCRLKNHMPSGISVNFTLVFEVELNVTDLTFDMEVKSLHSENGNENDNTVNVSIGVIIKAEVPIFGISEPSELYYNTTMYKNWDQLKVDVDLGPQLIHKYNIKNEGPFTLEETEIYIMWPYQTLTGDNFMYMLVEPQVTSNMLCDVNPQHINPNKKIHVRDPYMRIMEKELQGSNNTPNSPNKINPPPGNPDELNAIAEQCNQKFKCDVIRCKTGPVPKGQEIWVGLRSRVNVSITNEISKQQPLSVSTYAMARISLLYVKSPSNVIWQSAQTTTVMVSQLKPQLAPAPLPLWALVLAFVLGVLLLGCLIYGLYKCGFFKRNRPHAPGDALKESAKAIDVTSRTELHDIQLNAAGIHHNIEFYETDQTQHL